MKNLAIIPARGGSKRIPRKNVNPFLCKPMLAYSIEVALATGLFDEVMVNTDDGSMKRHWPEFENSRSQNLPKEYHGTGTFDWYKTKEWLLGDLIVGGIEVDETIIQDIDTETDWKLAKMKYKLIINKLNGGFFSFTLGH